MNSRKTALETPLKSLVRTNYYLYCEKSFIGVVILKKIAGSKKLNFKNNKILPCVVMKIFWYCKKSFLYDFWVKNLFL